MQFRKSGDWKPRKRFRIIVLQENVFLYAEIARNVGGDMTISGIQKHCVLSENTMNTKL